jgi:hypothetical protein
MSDTLQLTVIAGPDTGREISVPMNGATFGRGTQADITLADETLSRQHCRICRQGERWFIEDLQSRNGILVNGTKTPNAELKPGDIVLLGRTQLAVKQSAPVEPEHDPNETAALPPPSGYTVSPKAPLSRRKLVTIGLTTASLLVLACLGLYMIHLRSANAARSDRLQAALAMKSKADGELNLERYESAIRLYDDLAAAIGPQDAAEPDFRRILEQANASKATARQSQQQIDQRAAAERQRAKDEQERRTREAAERSRVCSGSCLLKQEDGKPVPTGGLTVLLCSAGRVEKDVEDLKAKWRECSKLEDSIEVAQAKKDAAESAGRLAGSSGDYTGARKATQERLSLAGEISGTKIRLAGAQKECVLASTSFWASARRYVAKETRTDPSGKFIFKELSPGDFYIICAARRFGNEVFWAERVTLPKESVALDNANAEIRLSSEFDKTVPSPYP